MIAPEVVTSKLANVAPVSVVLLLNAAVMLRRVDGEIVSGNQRVIAAHDDAILLCRRRDFAGAARGMERCLQADPEDRLAALYLGRCRELEEEAPPTAWDGVRLMTKKQTTPLLRFAG